MSASTGFGTAANLIADFTYVLLDPRTRQEA
jgi:ABC-type dipeptide/oligopeptide/nickel transport system permease component